MASVSPVAACYVDDDAAGIDMQMEFNWATAKKTLRSARVEYGQGRG